MYSNWQELLDAALSAGLVVSSIAGHGTLESGLNDPDNHDRIESELKESIDIAVKYKIPGLIAFSGNRRSGQSDYEGMVACARCLKRIMPYAEEKNITINTELLNSRRDHPRYQCDNTEWGVAMCEMVGSPRAKLLYDIYHMQIMEGDLIFRIRQYIGYIGHFHTAGNPGRNDMDNTQELNYRGICRAISDVGYEYYLGHEFTPKGDKLEALKTAFEICNV
jgi:hydroxypyruvate isomerase